MPESTSLPGVDVSVVICAYTEDRWDELVAAVESLGRQSRPPREVVVVADHNPSLLKRVRTELPRVVAVENRGRRGLSGARNSGISACAPTASQAGAIAFLDDDAVAAPDWLERLTAWFEHDEVAGVGSWVEPNWEAEQPRWFPREFNWVVGCSYAGLPEASAPVRNLFGGCMCVRREAFEAVGGFRSEMGRADAGALAKVPLGCEETEFCIRLQQRRPGSVLVYEPRARIYHRVPARRTTWGYFRARCFAEGMSKARMSSMVGLSDGLSTERAYTLRTLPRGVMRGLGDATARGDLSGLLRSGAILAGLAFTMLGFVAGTIADRFVGPERQWRLAGG
jgi:GT2 family glycosyltransferase